MAVAVATVAAAAAAATVTVAVAVTAARAARTGRGTTDRVWTIGGVMIATVLPLAMIATVGATTVRFGHFIHHFCHFSILFFSLFPSFCHLFSPGTRPIAPTVF